MLQRTCRNRNGLLAFSASGTPVYLRVVVLQPRTAQYQQVLEFTKRLKGDQQQHRWNIVTIIKEERTWRTWGERHGRTELRGENIEKDTKGENVVNRKTDLSCCVLEDVKCHVSRGLLPRFSRTTRHTGSEFSPLLMDNRLNRREDSCTKRKKTWKIWEKSTMSWRIANAMVVLGRVKNMLGL